MLHLLETGDFCFSFLKLLFDLIDTYSSVSLTLGVQWKKEKNVQDGKIEKYVTKQSDISQLKHLRTVTLRTGK